jgi:hypothetical protein
MTTMRLLLFPLFLLAAPPVARADGKKPSDEVDIEAVKPKLVFLHDGRGHYVAVVPFDSNAPVFYGDGKTFYQQRTFAYSHNQTEGTASVSFWAPTSVPRGGELELASGGAWTVRCSDRRTPMTTLDELETGKLLERAVFKKSMWKRKASALARDDSGVYYLVDEIRDDRPMHDQWDDPHPPTGFRLFIGRKGKLREQKITDTIVDSKGIVLATRSGRFSFDDNSKITVWSKGKKRALLIRLEVEDNTLLIYRDFGIYGKLGVPCDAL